MAFSALRQCKPWMQSPFSIRNLASSSSSGAARQDPAKIGMFKKFTNSLGPAAGPIGVLAATCSIAVMVAAHTAMLHVFRSPTVQVMKKNREIMPEVEHPDAMIESGDKFINKSFLRKVGHVQKKQYVDDTAEDIYTRSRASDTLRTVGVIGKK